MLLERAWRSTTSDQQYWIAAKQGSEKFDLPWPSFEDAQDTLDAMLDAEDSHQSVSSAEADLREIMGGT